MSAKSLVYLNTETGEFGKLPDLGIANLLGTAGPTFSVGGKPLLFADGTTTDGSPSFQFTLNQAYSNSAPAQINLTAGKNFVIKALNDTRVTVNAATGLTSFGSDITVNGLINGVNINALASSVLSIISSTAIKAYEHVQSSEEDAWTVLHGTNSLRPTVTIYDADNIVVLADEIRIVDANTVHVKFNTPIAGRALVISF